MISEAQAGQFRELGYFVAEGGFAPSLLQAMSAEMDRVYREHLEQARSEGEAAVAAVRHQRSFSQFHRLSAVAAQFVREPIYLEACRRFIGPDADLYYNQAATKPPERGRVFSWHQDSGYVPTEPLEYITCWTAITDSTLENGCIWIIPGSQKWGLLEHVPEPETTERYGGKTAQFSDESGAIPVEMRAGQVAIFSSLMLHKSGANTSTASIRRGYVPQYHSPKLIAKHTGQPWGDQVPVLRRGELVAV
ncbi:MAG: phytanoyl-CoA dioxygenase family protein [Candidatus Latescibacteria bacterium]|nr:phytanoyl-CoA dioxygenase family protein [Candidatus Latescibacterota bacterium]